MLFKNITAYALNNFRAYYRSNCNRFHDGFDKFEYAPLGAHDLSTMGWVEPCPFDDNLAHTCTTRFFLLKLAIEKRTIPASVVAKEVTKEAKKVEKDQGFYPGRKALKEIKERVIDLLTPRAFPITKYVSVIIDLDRDYLMIDTASATVADDVIKALFKVDDKFPVQLFRFASSVDSHMAAWIDEAPTGFTFDDKVKLKSGSTGKEVVYINMQAGGQTIWSHIAEGLVVSNMAMTYDDKISFVINEDATFSAIKAHDKLVREFSEDEDEFDANLILAGNELSNLVNAIHKEFGVMVEDSDGDLV